MTEKNDPKKNSLSLWDLVTKKRIKEMANTNLRIKDMLDDETLKKIQNQIPKIDED